jgi:hypothetical protein
MSNQNIDDRACQSCGKHFKYPSQLERHKNGQNQCKPRIKNFLCQHCNKSYSSNSNLHKHIKKCKNNVLKNNQSNQSNQSNQTVQITNDNSMNMLIDVMKNLVELITKQGNTGNIQNISNLLQAPNSNIHIDASNNQENNTNNITINTINTININTSEVDADFIYPFGYENIKFIPKEEMINILKSPIGAQLALEKTYSKLENSNFYKKNANKELITMISKDMSIKIDKCDDFNSKIANHGTFLMERMLMECDEHLEFKDKMAILANIEEIKKSLKFQVNLEGIIRFLECHYQSEASKAIIKKFLKSLVSNPFKERKLNIAKRLIKELKDFNEKLTNGNLTEEFLKNEVWSKKLIKNLNGYENNENNHLNNLNFAYYKNTPRYKFYKKMQDEEFNYFQQNGLSIINVYKYRKILLQRANDELNRISAEYDRIIYDDAKDALINEPNNILLNLVSQSGLTNDNNARENVISNLEDVDNDVSSEDSRLHDLSDISSIDNDELELINHRLIECDE